MTLQEIVVSSNGSVEIEEYGTCHELFSVRNLYTEMLNKSSPNNKSYWNNLIDGLPENESDLDLTQVWQNIGEGIKLES